MKNLTHPKTGFTLAEVLIALAIIGVVAALTVPTLLQKYTYRMTETRLAKFYSTYNQAIRLATIEHGEPATWEFAFQERDSENNAINKNNKSIELFDKYLGKHMKVVERKEVVPASNNKQIILNYLPDGSAFAYSQHTNIDIYYYPYKPESCIKKNTINGICMFPFFFSPYPSDEVNAPNFKYTSKYEMTPYVWGWDGTEQSLYKGNWYPTGCDMSEKGGYCTMLIAKNGWKIPKDYPRKIQY